MSEGGEALEDSKVGGLRFSIGEGMEEKGFEEEEEFSEGLRGGLVGGVVRGIIKGGGGVKDPLMDVVEGSKELKLCLVSEGSPQVGSEGGWGDGVCVEPLKGLGPYGWGSVVEGTVEKVGVGLGAQGTYR